jgi:2-phosphoglycerate kinase
LKITKKNGTISVFDDEKITKSILRANAEVPEETIDAAEAAAIADEVFSRLTEENNIIATADVRACVERILRERGLPETARHYMEYRK